MYCDYKEQSFESFYFNMYKILEIKLNKQLKEGIDNAWNLSTNEQGSVKANPSGRLGYAKYKNKSYEISNIIKEFE